MATDRLLDLAEQHKVLLTALDRLGAATPIQLAVEIARIPDEVRDELEKLIEHQLLKVYSREGYERQIYQLSDRGHAILKALT